MKKLFLNFTILAALASCDKGSNTVIPEPDDVIIDENTSVKGHLTYTGRIAMEEGPHHLLINDNNLYATRDRTITQFSIADPKIPALLKKYTYTSNLGQPYFADGGIYVPAATEGVLLQLDANLNFIKKHDLGITSFKPNVCFKSSEGDLWIGGSNGSLGILAKYRMISGTLTLQASYIASTSNSMIQSISEQGSHIIVSVASGHLWSFNKTSFSTGPVKQLTYEHEAGHEKWGYTICKVGTTAYWANWGAGLATVDFSSPADISIDKLITHSSFIEQFPDAEGTNVYDVVYNTANNILCIANGWSGVLLVQPGNSSKVYDYLDLQYIQNRSIATAGDYIYTGNISGGMSGDLKGIMIYKINM